MTGTEIVEHDDTIGDVAVPVEVDQPAAAPAAAGGMDLTTTVHHLRAAAEAESQILPKQFRGAPDDVTVAVLWGHEIGLRPVQALNSIHVVDGRPSLSAEARVAAIRGAGHSITGTAAADKATVTGRRRDTGDEMTVTWTIQQARDAGLAGKGNWKKYPAAMLWARAVSQLARMLFADVLAGASYDPEELEALPVPDAPTPAPAARQVDPPAADERTDAHVAALAELDALLDTAEQLGVNAPRAAARQHAEQGEDHARSVVERVQALIAEADDGPGFEITDSEPVGGPADGPTDEQGDDDAPF